MSQRLFTWPIISRQLCIIQEESHKVGIKGPRLIIIDNQTQMRKCASGITQLQFPTHEMQRLYNHLVVLTETPQECCQYHGESFKALLLRDAVRLFSSLVNMQMNVINIFIYKYFLFNVEEIKMVCIKSNYSCTTLLLGPTLRLLQVTSRDVVDRGLIYCAVI